MVVVFFLFFFQLQMPVYALLKDMYVFCNVLLNSWLKSSKNSVLPPGFLVLRLNHDATRACLNAQFTVFY